MAIEKYTTTCFVLESYERGEHDKVFKLFTREFGLLMAHAKSIRKLESKLRAHLKVGRMSQVTLVKGKEVWRLVGAEEVQIKSSLMRDVIMYLSRFIKGEGAHKRLYDRVVMITKESDLYDITKMRLLLLYTLLVGLGYADAKVIGTKTLKEYLAWDSNDLYTHLLLRHKEVRDHVLSVMKEMQL